MQTAHCVQSAVLVCDVGAQGHVTRDFTGFIALGRNGRFYPVELTGLTTIADFSTPDVVIGECVEHFFEKLSAVMTGVHHVMSAAN